jgi:uncharacterized protein YjeT (DUF2065 family)
MGEVLRILRRCADRLTPLAETALALAVLAWLLLLSLGPALAGHCGDWPGGCGGAALLGAALPTLLWARWRRRRADTLLERAWAETDRGDGAALLRLGEDYDRLSPWLGAGHRRRWALRLSEALAGAGGLQEAAARRLLALLKEGGAESPAALAAALGVLPETLPPEQRLILWNRVDAGGGPVDGVRVDRLCDALLGRRLRRGRPAWLPLVYARAREGSAEALSLLVTALNQRRLRPARLPLDLAARLLAHEALDPRLRPRRRVEIPEGQTAVDPGLKPGAEAASPAPATGRGAASIGAALAACALRARRGLGSLLGSAQRQTRRMAARPWADPGHLLRIAGGLVLVLGLVLASRWLTAPAGSGGESPADLALPGSLLHHDGGRTGGFTFQVLASKDSLQARQVADALRGQGLWAYLLGPRPNSAWYRVRVGRFERRAEADSVAGRLKEEQRIEAWYVANFETEGIIHGRSEQAP